MPLAVDDIEQVIIIVQHLGVVLSGNFNFDEHRLYTVYLCAEIVLN